MAITAAIFKFFKQHPLLNHKSDWALTWWEAWEWHSDSELLKSFHSDIQDGWHGGHLEILQRHLLPNHKLDWAETWWEASERHRDAELLKLFHSDIQDGCQAAIIIYFKQHLPNHVGLNRNLMGSIWATWRFRIAKIVTFAWAAIMKILKPRLLQNSKSNWA